MQEQVYQQQLPSISQTQFVHFPSNNSLIGRTFQKNFSTSTLHKAPLPPKLSKSSKSPLFDPTISTNTADSYNLSASLNKIQGLSQKGYYENQAQQGQNKQWISQDLKQKQDDGYISRNNGIDIESFQIRQASNVLKQDLGGMSSIFSVNPSSLQIIPISIDKRHNQQSGVVYSNSFANTPLYTAGQNTSPIQQMDLNMPIHLMPNEIIHANNGQATQPNQQVNVQTGQNYPDQAFQQQDRATRSSSAYITRQPSNSTDFKQFQIYLNKVSIDPNDYYSLNINKQNQNKNGNVSSNNQFNKESIQPIQKLDLFYINDGGGSPFTLNKHCSSVPPQPIRQSLQDNNSQFSSYLPSSMERQKDQFFQDENKTEGNKLRNPPIRTSTLCEKEQQKDMVTIIEVEDYGSIQNGYNDVNNKDNQQQGNQNKRNNQINQQSYDSNGSQKNQVSCIQRYESSNNGNQDSMLAGYQNYNSNGLQYNQNMNILSSIDSNVTAQEQSPFCSAIMKQSDFIRRKTSIEEVKTTNLDPYCTQSVMLNQNQTKINSKVANATSNNSEELCSDYYPQHKNSINQVNQAKKSESIQELNEEYSESIVLDKINQYENRMLQTDGFRVETQKQSKPIKDNKEILILANNLLQDEWQEYGKNQNLQQDETKTQYYLQKADKIIAQLEQQKMKSDKNENLMPKQTQYPTIPILQLQQKTPIYNHNNNSISSTKQPQFNSQLNSEQINSKSTIIAADNQSIPQVFNTKIIDGLIKPQLFTTESERPINQQHMQIPPYIPLKIQEYPQIRTLEPVQSATERRKANIDQIVQTCVERTQNLLEKLKSKSKRVNENNNKNQNTQQLAKVQIENKNMRHEEMRQSKQKVDQMFKEAVNRSRQVVERHAISKITSNSPPYFGQDFDINQQRQNQIQHEPYQNHSPSDCIKRDFAVYNRNSGSDGSYHKENNTFGYYSYGRQDKSYLSPNNQQNEDIQTQKEGVDKTGDEKKVKISPVESQDKSPYTEHYDCQLNSGSKANNSISFDIQAGNSGKSNQYFISPEKLQIEQFTSNFQNLQTSESKPQQIYNKKVVDLQNGLIFDGIIDANNWKQGYGILKNKENQSVIYEGEWKNNLFHGQGILYNQNPYQLNGSFKYSDFNDLNNYWKVYEGEFKIGQKNGSGTLILTNQEKYSGKFCQDRINGEGVFYLNDSSQQPIVGQWQNNILNKLL